MATLYLIGRILFGGYFLWNGLQHLAKNAALSGYAASKGVPWPKLAVGVSGLFILLGGLGVVTNYYVRPSLVLIAVFLILVSLKMHAFWKVTDPPARLGEMSNFLKNMALLGATLMLMYLY